MYPFRTIKEGYTCVRLKTAVNPFPEGAIAVIDRLHSRKGDDYLDVGYFEYYRSIPWAAVSIIPETLYQERRPTYQVIKQGNQTNARSLDRFLQKR